MTKLQGIHIASDLDGYHRRQAPNGTRIACLIEGKAVQAQLYEIYPDGDARVGHEGEMHIVRADKIISKE